MILFAFEIDNQILTIQLYPCTKFKSHAAIVLFSAGTVKKDGHLGELFDNYMISIDFCIHFLVMGAVVKNTPTELVSKRASSDGIFVPNIFYVI